MIKDESRLILLSRPDSLKPLLAFAREKAEGLGFDGEGRKEIELALEEAVTNVIEHAYEPGAPGRYEVLLARQPGRLLISVEDQGRRFDMGGEGSFVGLGFLLMGAFAQEIRFVGLGERGKRVEIFKMLPGRAIKEYAAKGEDFLAPAELEPGTPLEVRRAGTSDVLAMVRCVRRNGGWPAALDGFSGPEGFREGLGAGLVGACVAASERGGIAGVWAFVRDPGASRVAQAGGVLLDPAFRGGRLAEDMVFHLLEEARAEGASGLLAETPVSGSCLSGMAVLPFSAGETALLFKSGPGGAPREAYGSQGAALLEYVKLGDGPQKEIFPPFHHATMIRRIFERCRLPRVVGGTPAGETGGMPAWAQLEVHLLPLVSHVRILVREFGADLLDRLFPFVEEMDRRGVSRVHLDLSLQDPRTASFTAPLEALGFSFAGVLPELGGGDLLRLQHLREAPARRPDCPGLTDFGEELLDYVWKGTTS